MFISTLHHIPKCQHIKCFSLKVIHIWSVNLIWMNPCSLFSFSEVGQLSGYGLDWMVIFKSSEVLKQIKWIQSLGTSGSHKRSMFQSNHMSLSAIMCSKGHCASLDPIHQLQSQPFDTKHLVYRSAPVLWQIICFIQMLPLCLHNPGKLQINQTGMCQDSYPKSLKKTKVGFTYMHPWNLHVPRRAIKLQPSSGSPTN